MAVYLLEHGADQTIVNEEGKSVYEQALELENDAMVEFWAARLGITITMRPADEEEEQMGTWEDENGGEGGAGQEEASGAGVADELN